MINFDLIQDEIFVGTCPTSLIDIQRLKQAGFSAVLNLQTDHDFSKLGIRWNQMEEGYMTMGIGVSRVPIVDFDDADLTTNLPTATATLASIADNGSRIYVHCTAGQQRAPSTVIGYLAWHRNLGLGKALDIVTNARNCAPPLHVLEAVDKSIAAN